MNASLLIIRSLAVEFAMRLYKPIAVTVVIVAVLLLGLSVWLTTVNELWWIFVILLTFLTFIVVTILTVLWVVMRMIAPTQTRQQKKQAKALVDKMMRVAEITATPKFVLLFRVIRDALVPTKSGFIASITDDTASLRKDFLAFRNTFN
jgi:hypothetical protein